MAHSPSAHTHRDADKPVVGGGEWLGLPSGEPIPGKTYRADGWVYRDLPRMTPEYFGKLIDLIGEDNIVWLSLADYGDTKRGQMLVSPAGMQRLRDRSEAPTEPQAGLSGDEGEAGVNQIPPRDGEKA